ncbi:MAG: hypothetical protein Q9166_006147 [cf. Caloplaca sp. 2 TL-2023]
MAEQFVDLCLQIYRDDPSVEDHLEELQERLSALSPLRGNRLEKLVLDVAHLCRDRIKAEQASPVYSPPTPRPRAPRVVVQSPSEPSPRRPDPTPSQPQFPFPAAMPSTPTRFNPNAPAFTPSSWSSPPLHYPSAPVCTPSASPLSQSWGPSYQERGAEMHEAYQNRVRALNAGIAWLDNVWIAMIQGWLDQAEAEIKRLKEEVHNYSVEFFDNFPDNKGDWTIYDPPGSHRVWAWTVRNMQIEALRTWIKEVPEVYMRHLQELRESYFKNLFPEPGELGPAE